MSATAPVAEPIFEPIEELIEEIAEEVAGIVSQPTPCAFSNLNARYRPCPHPAAWILIHTQLPCKCYPEGRTLELCSMHKELWVTRGGLVKHTECGSVFWADEINTISVEPL